VQTNVKNLLKLPKQMGLQFPILGNKNSKAGYDRFDSIWRKHNLSITVGP